MSDAPRIRRRFLWCGCLGIVGLVVGGPLLGLLLGDGDDTAAVADVQQTAAAPNAVEPIQPHCDPAYLGVCIPSPPPDLSCEDVEFRGFVALPPDPHGFDRNQNGIGCESEPDPNNMVHRLSLWVMTAPRILLGWFMRG